MTKKQKLIQEFNMMIDTAEMKAWQKTSLERPLTSEEFARFKEVTHRVYDFIPL